MILYNEVGKPKETGKANCNDASSRYAASTQKQGRKDMASAPQITKSEAAIQLPARPERKETNLPATKIVKSYPNEAGQDERSAGSNSRTFAGPIESGREARVHIQLHQLEVPRTRVPEWLMEEINLLLARSVSFWRRLAFFPPFPRQAGTRYECDKSCSRAPGTCSSWQKKPAQMWLGFSLRNSSFVPSLIT